ncbi:MAG: hypothetical protein LCH61_08915 [Proteobacteria bacterium]|nr:hypothetical protein [Pseudomonadota bacterium]
MVGVSFSARIAMLLILGAATSAGAQSLEAARENACDALRKVHINTSAIQHESTDVIVEEAKAWAPTFNRFAVSGSALKLRRHAQQALRSYSGSYPEAVCRNLRPLYALSYYGYVAVQNKVRLTRGQLLSRCSSVSCIPLSISKISEACDFVPAAIPAGKPAC